MKLVESIDHGWSLEGHYYVHIVAFHEHRRGVVHLVCRDKDQAKGIADALGEQTEAMARARAEGYLAGLEEGKRNVDLSVDLEEAEYMMSQIIGKARARI